MTDSRRHVRILRPGGGFTDLPFRDGWTATNYLDDANISYSNSTVLVNGISGNGEALAAGAVISLSPQGMKSGR